MRILTRLKSEVHLFFTAFLKQVPIVHIATWSPNEKPLVLIAAMRACGALFVSTQTANDFIMATLASARVFLAQEFVSNWYQRRDVEPTDTRTLVGEGSNRPHGSGRSDPRSGTPANDRFVS
jgi:hypothetical protein